MENISNLNFLHICEVIMEKSELPYIEVAQLYCINLYKLKK
jgi:hypothetical protein